jgi:cysteinyl-tRNA synthetase
VLRIRDFLSQENAREKAGSEEKALEEMLGKFSERFREAMDDDFNTALAIGIIFELIRMLNKYMDGRPSGKKAVELIKKADELLKETGNVLNLFNRTPEEWYIALMSVKNIGLSEGDIVARISERRAARERKDWAEADRIRKELEEKGILLEDRKDGTGWKVKV